jgi:outer membrane protein OmpA-like peptidoglycan-associated protein
VALQGQIAALSASDDLAPVLAERDERIAALTTELAGRDTTIAGLQAEMATLRADLARTLTDRDERIGALDATLAGRDAVVERLRQELGALRSGADLGPALAALETESERRIEALTASLAEREVVIGRLQNDIEALRAGTELAPPLAAGDSEPDKPVLAVGDQASEPARLAAMLDALQLAPEATMPIASPAMALRLVPALRPAGEDGPLAEVHFETGSARLSPGGLARAAAAAVTLADMPRSRIRLVGYADRTGSAAANRRLAERRAEAVADFLVANGLPAELIETSGMTEPGELPVATGPGVPEPLNRSVSIIAEPMPTG